MKCFRYKYFAFTAFALIFLATSNLKVAGGQESPNPEPTLSEQKAVESAKPPTENNQKTKDEATGKKKQRSKKKEDAAQSQLKLGEIYEAAEQFKEAEAAYVKALESELVPTRTAAIDGVKRIIDKRESVSQKYFSSPFESVSTTFVTTVFTSLLSLFTLLLVFLSLKFPVKFLAEKFGDWRGKKILMIEAFTDTTERKLGDNLQKVFEFTRKLIDAHYQAHNLIVSGVKMPYLLESQKSNVTELAESFAPEGWGKVISWLGGNLKRPEFTIQGTIQESGTNLDVFVILVRRGEVLRSWSRRLPTSGAASLLDDQKDLAYEVLMYLKEYLEK